MSSLLVTPYTTTQGIKPETLDKLFALRLWNPERDGQVPFAWPSRLRTHHRTTGHEIRLRDYQKVAIHHLTHMPRFMLGDAVGLGKTIDCIAASAYIQQRHPSAKVVVLTTKSTTYQWRSEYEDFSEMRALVLQDSFAGLKSYEARYAQFEAFFASQKLDVMIAKYSSMIGKRRVVDTEWDEHGNATRPGSLEAFSQEMKRFIQIFKPHAGNLILILDEAHKFMHGNQTRKLVMNLARHATAVWALTATSIKNRLDEFYGIGSAIGIRPLGYLDDFRDQFCVMQKIHIGGGRMKDVIRGYQNIPEFKTALRPFFLGRSQKQVKEPLPQLQTTYHPIDLSDEQADLLLNKIPSGEFQLPPRLVEVLGEIHEVARDPNNKMTMLSLYQLVANHPCLIDPSDTKTFYTKALSPKEEALLDMLDGDFDGEKVIVFSKYRSHINRLERLTKDGHFTKRKFLRITGAESEKQRDVNKRLFQDPSSGYDLIFINTAGMEGINLQSAAHMILLDAPWSWGDLIQIVGRMIRMASPHSMCTLHVLVANGTIDEYAIETLKGKKEIFEAILGESHSAGLLDDKTVYDLSSGMDAVGSDEEFHALLSAHAKSMSMTKVICGVQLAKAMEDEDYVPMFQRKKNKKKTKADNHEKLFETWGGDTVS